MAEQKQVKYDVDGYDAVTSALRELLNQYPELKDGSEISFSVLGKESGKAMFPISGAVIESETRNILGNVRQVCLYPFYVIYRASGLSENNKAKVKEWLDSLGKWLESVPYPPLTDGRKFLSISRQSPAYLESVNDNQSENWAIHISARYEYKK